MGRKLYFATTAIDYPNAEPHVGTAFEKVGADVQARFQKLLGRESFLLMGNDENTQKVAIAAKKKGQDTQAYADAMAENFRKTWKSLDIDCGYFCQTSDKKHHAFCQAFFKRCRDNGFVYPRKYEGLYCNECEEFKNECSAHSAPLETRSEENYFFRWSAFQKPLLDFYKSRQLRIRPQWRQDEMVSFIEKELRDISVTRKNQGWGIPVDDSQVIYVWFDALLNYVSFSGGRWPADCHVIGKDIVRFHGALLPAMILAHNVNNPDPLPLPSFIFSHGFVVGRTETGLTKFAKSGLNLGPNALVESFGSDAYRYLFMKSANFADDCEYTFGAFAELYNADLVNKYGNLFSRVCRLIGDRKLQPKKPDEQLLNSWKEHFENFEYRSGLLLAVSQIDAANKLMDDKKPWAEDAQDVDETLAECARVLKTVAFLFAPVMPKSSRTVWNTLGDHLDDITFRDLPERLQRPLMLDKGRLENGKVPVLFPRYKG